MPRLDIPAEEQENYITITSEKVELGDPIWDQLQSDIEELLATKYDTYEFDVDLDDRGI
jgi:hypothetical protein